MAPEKPKLWILLIFGIPALLGGVAQWGNEPRPVWAYVSLTSGLVLITLFLVALWMGRRSTR